MRRNSGNATRRQITADHANGLWPPVTWGFSINFAAPLKRHLPAVMTSMADIMGERMASMKKTRQL